jgi:hypothetical protein
VLDRSCGGWAIVMEGGWVWLMVCGQQKNQKKRAAGPTERHPREGRKKGGQGQGRHCIRAPHRMAHGAIRRGICVSCVLYRGVQCHTHRPYSHQGGCDGLKVRHGLRSCSSFALLW